MRLKFLLVHIFLLWTIMYFSNGFEFRYREGYKENFNEDISYGELKDQTEDDNGSENHEGDSQKSPSPRSKSAEDLCPWSPAVKMVCSCFPEYEDVRKAICWIIFPNMTYEDATWNRFSTQAQLESLSLFMPTDMYLTYIPDMTFASLKKLKSLVITFGKIQALKTKIFQDLRKLESINLERNLIKILEKESFSDLNNLRYINLNYNHISRIERGAFKDLPALRNVSLNFNNLSTFPEDIFWGNIRIFRLLLSHNKIATLTNSSFKGLGNLKVLKLDFNKLTSLDGFAFTELWELEELDLSNNFISMISNRAFEGLINLRVLRLHNNKITSLDSDIFLSTTSLYKISLQNNSLETLKEETFEPIIKNLIGKSGVVEIEGNKFVCDCKLNWIYELLNSNPPLMLKNSLGKFVCTLMNPKTDDFKIPISMDILSAIKNFSQSVDGLKDNYDICGEAYQPHESHSTEKKGVKKPIKVKNLGNSTVPSEKLCGKARGIPAPLYSLKKRALICHPVIQREPSLSKNSSSNNHGMNFIRDTILLSIYIMLCVIFFAFLG